MAKIKFPEIFINGDKISCDNPEDMKTFNDILDSMSGYCFNLKPSETITEIKVDGKDIDIYSPEADIKTSEINRIDFTSMTLQDVAFNNLDILITDMEAMKKFVTLTDNASSESILKKQEEIQVASDTVIRETIELFPTSHICKMFYTLKETTATLTEKIFGPFKTNKTFSSYDEITIKECTELADNCIQIIVSIKKSIAEAAKIGVVPATYNNTLPGTIDSIKDILPQMSNVSQMLTAGHDKDAMGIVAYFSEILANSLGFYTVFTQSPNSNKYKGNVNEDFFKDLKGKLEELMHAMMNNDSILIGDLMEYEFIPALEEILSFLLEMINS